MRRRAMNEWDERRMILQDLDIANMQVLHDCASIFIKTFTIFEGFDQGGLAIVNPKNG